MPRDDRMDAMRVAALSYAGLVLALCLGLAPARGEDERLGLAWMAGDEIRTVFAGRRLSGIYPNLSQWSEEILADGTSDYREGAKHWRGEWWIADRGFCFAYPPPGIGGCFLVTRVSRNCYELYETTGLHGGSAVPPSTVGAWNGRMWIAAEPPTCEEALS